MATVQPIHPNVGQAFGVNYGKTTTPIASILSKDVADFFTKRDDLLKDIFMDNLAGDMSKWKFHTSSSTHQVIVKGPKGWTVVGNQHEGQLLHDGKVIYRATSADYHSLKPMAVTVVQIIQKAMDTELERLKSSLVTDLDTEEDYDDKHLPSFLVGADELPKYSTLSTASAVSSYGIIRDV